MKVSWIIALGIVAACGAGCDDTSDGTGGSGTTSSSSTKASSGTMSTTSTTTSSSTSSSMSSTSTGGNQQTACSSAAAALGAISGDLMCDPNQEAATLAACNKNFTDFPMCTMELIAYWSCVGTDTPMATCECDAMTNEVTCTGVCGTEFTDATTCATM